MVVNASSILEVSSIKDGPSARVPHRSLSLINEGRMCTDRGRYTPHTIWSTLILRTIYRLSCPRPSARSQDDLATQHKQTLHARQQSDINPWTAQPYTARYQSILQTRLKLPVYQFQSQLLEAVAGSQTVIVEGETGSGE